MSSPVSEEELINQFQTSWENAITAEDHHNVFLTHTHPHSLTHSLHSIATSAVQDKLYRYAMKYQHQELSNWIQIPLFLQFFLDSIEKLINGIFSSLKRVDKQSSIEEKEKRIATFLFFFSIDEKIYQKITNGMFIKALHEFLDLILIEKLCDFAAKYPFNSGFRVTSTTITNYSAWIRYNRPVDKELPDQVMKLLQDSMMVSQEKLNKIGRYVNRNVILNEEIAKERGAFIKPFTPHEYGDGEYPFTTLELRFNALSRLIREKDAWRSKCREPTLQAKWKSEIMEQGGDVELFELVLQQVQLLAQIGVEDLYEVSPVDHVYSSDSIINAETLQEFKLLVDDLQRVIPTDYHPGSNQQVVDIVHPSLYPLVVGVSRVRERPALTLEKSWKQDLGNLGLSVLTGFDEGPANDFFTECFSKKFQWLPAEFHVEADATVHINSYVNNLHPQLHASMYPLLARIFSDCLPMMEQVLSDNVLKDELRLIDDPDSHEMYDDEEPSDIDDDDAYDEFYENRIPLDIPLPESFPSENLKGFLHKNVSLRDKRLQVIVKMASIELTPEQPKYGGGTWHVEGMENEGIVCTLIHYYSCENITESRLSFRQAICEPEYEQSDDRGVMYRYALEDEAPLNQELGDIIAKEGRSVAFPNLYQHCVKPFELADKTQPGHRKILVYFLVDPLRRVMSTADIPPQQRSWLDHQHNSNSEADSELHRLLRAVAPVPDDVISYMLEFLDFPLSRSVAEDLRQELMTERSVFVDELNESVFERPFSLCEH